MDEVSRPEIDAILFRSLQARGIAPAWAERRDPRSELVAECELLGSDKDFLVALSAYLEKNPVISQSLETVLAQLAFSAGVNWREAPEVLRPLARRGWHISRWLPTFLLIDGPLGRLFRDRNSPLAERLKASPPNFPLLSSARDLFNNNTFRQVRNGFAHWSFTWRDQANSANIGIVNWESGAVETQITLLEAEALHFVSATIIRTVDESLLRRAVGSRHFSLTVSDTEPYVVVGPSGPANLFRRDVSHGHDMPSDIPLPGIRELIVVTSYRACPAKLEILGNSLGLIYRRHGGLVILRKSIVGIHGPNDFLEIYGSGVSPMTGPVQDKTAEVRLSAPLELLIKWEAKSPGNGLTGKRGTHPYTDEPLPMFKQVRVNYWLAQEDVPLLVENGFTDSHGSSER